MTTLICHIPTKQERYTIADIKLSDDELWHVAREVVENARIWHEDPRQWVDYNSFLGHQISKALFIYHIGWSKDGQMNQEEMDKFVGLVFAISADENQYFQG